MMLEHLKALCQLNGISFKKKPSAPASRKGGLTDASVCYSKPTMIGKGLILLLCEEDGRRTRWPPAGMDLIYYEIETMFISKS